MYVLNYWDNSKVAGKKSECKVGNYTGSIVITQIAKNYRALMK